MEITRVPPPQHDRDRKSGVPKRQAKPAPPRQAPRGDDDRREEEPASGRRIDVKA